MVESIHVDGTNLYVFCTNICASYEIQVYDIIELIKIKLP